MIDIFKVQYIYHIIYSQYEKIFKDLQYVYNERTTSDYEQTFTVTINQPSDSNNQIVVTTLNDGKEHTSSFTATYNTVAICKFKNSNPTAYLSNPAAVITSNTTFDTLTAPANNQTMVILIHSPCQTIRMSINNGGYDYTTSKLVDNGSELNFMIHTDHDAQYMPGVLNKTRIINVQSGIEYIYITLPYRYDTRLHESDILILDAGYSDTEFPKEKEIDNTANDGICYESDYYNFKA